MLDPQGESLAGGRILNIGLGGALLECPSTSPPGKMLTVVLIEHSGLQLAARVVNQRPHGEELHISVRFLNHPDSPEVGKLKSVLLELLTRK